MSSEFAVANSEFYKYLYEARASDTPTTKLDRFMAAYDEFKRMHTAVGMSVPTANGEKLTKETLRSMVTEGDLQTEFDEEEFEMQASMMEDKVQMLEEAMENNPF